jgi:nicotinate phosphoribosyltransferase
MLYTSIEKSTDVDTQIIDSLLDTDFYKFTMGQLVFRKFRDVPVKYALINRTKTNLSDIIDEGDLRRQLDCVSKLKITNSELHYLRGTNEYGGQMFSDDYLQFLRDLRLPDYSLKIVNNDYVLEFEGPWSQTIYWETLALSIVNELLFRSMIKEKTKFGRDVIYATGQTRLASKIELLKKHPDITFTDFGTRRRFSKDWHDYVINTLTNEVANSQFRGTSNVALAMKYGLVPMGTSAHEMFMVLAGVERQKATNRGDEPFNTIRDSHNQVLKLWWEQYGYGLSIALTDTYGSDFFFRDMTREQARTWKGLRQDSGDPIEFGEKAIKFYNEQMVNPMDKIIIFSDGLDVDSIIKIHNHFKGRIKTTFGWGTNLTNDLGLHALSIVVKPVRAYSQNLVKLSDNLSKATGQLEDVELMKKIFNYMGNSYVECKY